MSTVAAELLEKSVKVTYFDQENTPKPKVGNLLEVDAESGLLVLSTAIIPLDRIVIVEVENGGQS